MGLGCSKGRARFEAVGQNQEKQAESQQSLQFVGQMTDDAGRKALS